ncbi:MAG TPA: polyketide cyclase [Henriciella marina]|uniref:SRPBCC family protein n=1 Tax=Henriciella sp. TaxID=1968823 RepID=UPI0018288107|nr:SRPBCC family protein [Henriciella sp.]HIG23949.1 polyketide cyclase [Henriciella sp.]HIK65387.1 polyketide cyclase [Henriciella marina]
MNTSKTELDITRLIKAPPEKVWTAWSEPKHFARWWIPAPIECQVVKLDLHPGGGFETLMREPGKDWQPHVDGCVLDVVAGERIVFTTALREGWHPVDSWLTLTAIITLKPEDGGTRYSARVLHKTPEDSQKHDDMGFHEGWGTAIDQLAAFVGAQKDN